MTFIISNINKIKREDLNYLECNHFSLHYSDEIVLFKSRNQIILGKIPSSLILLLKSSLDHDKNQNKTFKEIAEKNTNGYLLHIDLETSICKIYTDIYGFYGIYYIQKQNEFIISDDYSSLLPLSDHKINYFALLDLYLFNYTLFDRTTFTDIKKVLPGTEFIIEKQLSEKVGQNGFITNFKLEKNSFNKSLSVKKYSKLLKKEVNKEISKKDICLTVTAGFDSRMLLATISNMNISFESATFGQKGNIEIETIKNFINNYSKKHNFVELNEKYINKVDDHLNDLIESNLANPCAIEIAHYHYFFEQIKPSQIFVGFMGGEIFSGQSLGSQVTFTEFAAHLLQSKSIDQLETKFQDLIQESHMFDQSKISRIKDEYLSSLKPYLQKKNNINVLTFLINEKFGKFFGTINRVATKKHELIIPFMAPELIKYILNSKNSFLRKNDPLKQNPFVNIKTKIFQAKVINTLEPSLKNTHFDRLYKVKDLIYPHGLTKVIYGYFKSHYLKTNKKTYPRPHISEKWYTDFVLTQINKKHSIEIEDILKRNEFSFVDYKNLSRSRKQRLGNIAYFISAINKLKNE